MIPSPSVGSPGLRRQRGHQSIENLPLAYRLVTGQILGLTRWLARDHQPLAPLAWALAVIAVTLTWVLLIPWTFLRAFTSFQASRFDPRRTSVTGRREARS